MKQNLFGNRSNNYNMQCQKCGLPMQPLSQILIKKEGKKENTRMPTTWKCQNDHYHHENYDDLKK